MLRKIIKIDEEICKRIENAVKKALIDSDKFIPWQIINVSTDGKILD